MSFMHTIRIPHKCWAEIPHDENCIKKTICILNKQLLHYVWQFVLHSRCYHMVFLTGHIWYNIIKQVQSQSVWWGRFISHLWCNYITIAFHRKLKVRWYSKQVIMWNSTQGYVCDKLNISISEYSKSWLAGFCNDQAADYKMGIHDDVTLKTPRPRGWVAAARACGQKACLDSCLGLLEILPCQRGHCSKFPVLLTGLIRYAMKQVQYRSPWWWRFNSHFWCHRIRNAIHWKLKVWMYSKQVINWYSTQGYVCQTEHSIFRI